MTNHLYYLDGWIQVLDCSSSIILAAGFADKVVATPLDPTIKVT